MKSCTLGRSARAAPARRLLNRRGTSGRRACAPLCSSARLNASTEAAITGMSEPFAQGAFRWVAMGHYTKGPRKDEKCVTKWFKTGVVYESSYFDLDIKAVDKAQEIINAFNAENVITSTVYLNHPEVWTFQPNSGYDGQRNLTEPFIEGFQKFNSNSGIVPQAYDTDGWPALMQALSHYSYHKTGGRYVLCDLQGGVWPDGGGAVLTDPVILSRDREFGPTDLGSAGISTFFARHTCNKFCQGHWHKPKDKSVYFEANEGTTFM
eukprot:gene5007-34792_t